MTKYAVSFELQIYAPDQAEAVLLAAVYMGAVLAKVNALPREVFLQEGDPGYGEGWGMLDGTPHTAEGFGWRCFTSIKPAE